MTSTVTEREALITNAADVPADIIKRDHELHETVKTTQVALDKLRWESITNPDGPRITITAYAKAVGRSTQVVKVSVDAWALSREAETSDAGEITAEDHAFKRVVAEVGAKEAAAVGAVAKVTGKSLGTAKNPAHRKVVREVQERAEELQVKAGKAEVDDVILERAARQVTDEHKAISTLRQQVKVAMMDNRGTRDFKAVTEAEVESLITFAEAFEGQTHHSREDGEPLTWDEALALALLGDRNKLAAAREAAFKDAQATAVLSRMRYLIINANKDLYLAVNEIPKLAAVGMTPDQQEQLQIRLSTTRSMLDTLDRFLADDGVVVVDWDAALADLLKGGLEDDVA